MKIEKSTIINLPVNEVFSFAGDIENDTQWVAGRVETKRTSPGSTTVGSRFMQVNKFLGKRMESIVEVTEYEPNRRIRSKSISGPATFTDYRLFEHAGDGNSTKLTIVLEGEAGGLFKVAEPILARMTNRQAESDLAEAWT